MNRDYSVGDLISFEPHPQISIPLASRIATCSDRGGARAKRDLYSSSSHPAPFRPTLSFSHNSTVLIFRSIDILAHKQTSRTGFFDAIRSLSTPSCSTLSFLCALSYRCSFPANSQNRIPPILKDNGNTREHDSTPPGAK
jgi:hypothetical protein